MTLDFFCLLLRRILALLLVASGAFAAEQTPFDLAGPQLDITVTRGTVQLPIAEVPSLVAHDRLQIVPRVADAQNARYLMVAAFLRGPTDPPPEQWFTRCDTWKAPCAQTGLSVEVPEGAQQMLLFFAPQTGGDYRTLVNAVRGKPGAFVRAAQQLRQAGLDRVRLDHYLALLQELAQKDPAKVKTAAPQLARSLAIKFDEKCLDRIPALQAPCLMQGSDALILNDGHGESLVSMVTTGVGRDLAIHAGDTALLGSGNYSSVIGSILDFGRLMDSLHTAQYQYIPAMPALRGNGVILMLNTPPSFHKPMSVLVAAMPSIEVAHPPMLHALEPKRATCINPAPFVLPVDGYALIYSTRFAHDMALEGHHADGSPLRWPARADALKGGYVIDAEDPRDIDESVPAHLTGQWGFDRFEGPEFALASPRPREWQADADARARVVAGRESVLTVSAERACFERARLTDDKGRIREVLPADGDGPNLDLRLPLDGVRPGSVTLTLSDRGGIESPSLTLTVFQEPSRIDRASVSAGENSVTVIGEGLVQLTQLTAGNVVYRPDGERVTDGKPLTLTTDAEWPADWNPGNTVRATADLRDGRTLPVNLQVLPQRPQVRRLALSSKVEERSGALPIHLAEGGEIPVRSTVTFSVAADAPTRFTPSVKLELEATEAETTATLDLRSGGLTLLDSRTLVASVDLLKTFGASLFGPLRFRVLLGDDVSTWLPVGHVVRLPSLHAPNCPAAEHLPCSLPGSQLYLIESVASTPEGSDAVHLEVGYTGDSVLVPRPRDGHLYLRLRDDPSHPASIDVSSSAH